MAKAVSRKACVRKTMKTLHKKARTLRQHQLVAGKAAKKCAAKRTTRRTMKKKSTKRCPKGTHKRMRGKGSRCVKNTSRKSGMKKDVQGNVEPMQTALGLEYTTQQETMRDYQREFQDVPCDKELLSKTKREFAREVMNEVGAGNYPSDPRAAMINSAESDRIDECKQEGLL